MHYLGALEVAFPSEGVELAQIEREKHDGVKPIPDKGWNITNNEKMQLWRKTDSQQNLTQKFNPQLALDLMSGVGFKASGDEVATGWYLQWQATPRTVQTAHSAVASHATSSGRPQQPGGSSTALDVSEWERNHRHHEAVLVEVGRLEVGGCWLGENALFTRIMGKLWTCRARAACEGKMEEIVWPPDVEEHTFTLLTGD